MALGMARVDDTSSLASAEADVSHDAARRLDLVFRSGAGIFSILLLLIAWEAPPLLVVAVSAIGGVVLSIATP